MLYFHLDQYMWELTTRTLDSGPTKLIRTYILNGPINSTNKFTF